MPFTLDTWKAKLREHLPGWRARMQRLGITSAYATVSAAALWPVVEAARGGEWAALAALGTVAAGVGTNLLANQLQGWQDEGEAARQLAATVPQDPALRAELDAVLQKLDALTAAREALPAADRPWYVARMREELGRLGSPLRDLIIAGGDIATDHSAVAKKRGVAIVGDGNMVVSGEVRGDLVMGDQYKTDGAPRADAAALRCSYLTRVLEQTQTLQLSGVDPKTAKDQTAHTGLALAAVYTALMTQAVNLSQLPRDYLNAKFEQLTPREIRILQLQHGLFDGRHYLQDEIGQRFGVSGSVILDIENEAMRRLRFSALEIADLVERVVLLGDPGSGKSTFVNFVALCLAGEGLGNADANLALMTTTLPEEERSGHDEKPAPQPWHHAALLPVRVVLRDLAARGLPPVGQRASGDHLWRFIKAELGETLTGYAPHLYKELQESGGLILLDGLDEVPEADARRVQVKQAVQGFASDFPRCRFVVTSRTYAYQKQDWKLPGFAEAVLAPFGWGQIERFVDNWYAHLAVMRSQNREDAQGRAALLKAAIEHNVRLRELAERPLLLTLMASLHAWRGGNLPEKREELYADTVDLLLDQWESPKTVRGPDGQPMVEPSLTEWARVDKAAVRKLLERLAFEAHRSQPNLVGTADIPQERLVNGLVALANHPDVRPARVIEYVRDRAGLLAARGVGVYTFPHRTFQEYLAACYLTDHGYPDELAELVLADGERWREVALLAGAKAARGTISAAWNLAEALCCNPAQPEVTAAQYLAALLAAQTLIENGALAPVNPRNRPKAECIRGWLRAIAQQGVLAPVGRAAAGDALAAMGDDRSGVGLTAGGLPDIVWCEVPAGEFVMGSKDDTLAFIGKETPQQRLHLGAYRISKYPITNAQYAAFVEDGGYTERWRKCWTKAGWAWKEKRSEPGKVGGVYDLPNHPVVMITWYEALAFCNWLSERSGLKVMLPTEAQWEKAARGTDRRIYPWGPKLIPDHANHDETGINTTSAAGIFPKGASPYGALDMSGNVWEWCLTKWRGDYKTPEDNSPEGIDTRVLRGGAFLNYAWDVRCASRYGAIPYYWGWYLGFRVVAPPVV